MVEREGRLRVDDPGKRRRNLIEPVLVHGKRQHLRLDGRHFPVELVRRHPAPDRRVLGHAGKRRHETGIEPSSTTCAHDTERAMRPFLVGEDLGHLRQSDDAREQRDVPTFQPLGVSAAVPVLVHRPDGFGGHRRKSKALRDLRATVATDLIDRPANLASAACKREKTLDPGTQGAARLREFQRVRRLATERPPVALPGAALGGLIVAAEHLEHALRIRGAARVFQEQGVKEVLLVGFRQSDDARQLHADETRPG